MVFTHFSPEWEKKTLQFCLQNNLHKYSKMYSHSYPFIPPSFSFYYFVLYFFKLWMCNFFIFFLLYLFCLLYFGQWCTALNGKLCLKYVNFDLFSLLLWLDNGLIKKQKHLP